MSTFLQPDVMSICRVQLQSLPNCLTDISGKAPFQGTSEWLVRMVKYHGLRICYTLSYCLEVIPYLLVWPCPDGFTLRKLMLMLMFTFPPCCSLSYNWIYPLSNLPVRAQWFSLFELLNELFIPATPALFQSVSNKAYPPTCMHTDTLFRLIKAVWVLNSSSLPKYESAH